jgi:serine phosphatase RsbU (regulator of sigma subunit)
MRLNGALTIPSILEHHANNPPIGMIMVPSALLIYAIWQHSATIHVARKTITQQRNEIADKNKDITDSINYARNLQEALLPPMKEIRSAFPGSEIYFRPKAIVAGDFYWMETAGSKVFIAAADCTGHGVPGAMVSVICSGALTRSVREFHLQHTGAILDKTRELILEAFEKGGGVNDGMDISLLCVDKASGKVTWSGANNPLWIVSNGEVQVTRADKQPVGKNEHHHPFTDNTITVPQGSAVYLFTDGFADQFGGPEGKKFKYKQLQEFFLENHSLNPAARIKKLDEVFLAWKGNLEQVDDVCILALEF